METTAARPLAAVAGLAATGLAAGLRTLAFPAVLAEVKVEGFLVSAFFSSSSFFFYAGVILAVVGLAVAAGLAPLADAAPAVPAGLVTGTLPVAGLPATPLVFAATGAYADN